MSISDFGARFRPGIRSGDRALTPLGSILLARRSHGYPVFLPAAEEAADGCVAIALPVQDDAMILSPSDGA